MNPSVHSDRLNRVPSVPVQPKHAFTLIELLVVLAMVTLLAMTLLPALAKAKYPSMVSNCTANYKQWVQIAAVYASAIRRAACPPLKLLLAPEIRLTSPPIFFPIWCLMG